MTPLLIIGGVYIAGAAITGAVVSVMNRLERRANPGPVDDAEDFYEAVILWPVLVFALLALLVHRHVLSPVHRHVLSSVLDKLTDTVEAIISERKHQRTKEDE